MSVAMKLHNFCIEQDGVTGRRSWESVNESLQPQELAELDADRGRFVREMRELKRCVLDRWRDEVAGTQSVARRTRSHVPSRKREVLKCIVKEKGVTLPTLTVV